MLASSKAKCSKTLALPVIHYEFYKSVMQSVELFCVYRKSGKTTNPPSHLLLGLTGILYLFSCKSQVYIQSIVCVLNLLFYKNLMVPDPRKFPYIQSIKYDEILPSESAPALQILYAPPQIVPDC